MEFLKQILGDELYTQFESKIKEYNGLEANKDKQIQLVNSANGKYISKSEYDSLNETLKGKQTELDTANTLISDLKKGTKGNEDLQSKITGYETDIAKLQSQLAETKLNSAVKVALYGAKAADVDYLTFKLNESLKAKNEVLELDENDKIKGWDNRLSELKAQFPNMFNSDSSDGYKLIGDNRLPEGETQPGIMTRSELLKKPYSERAEFQRENPEAYAEIMKS